MRVTTLELQEPERIQLENGYKNGENHRYRIRCKSILLKSEGKAASEIATLLDVTIPTVYAWLRHYKQEGIKGLVTQAGQGRKPIIGSSDEDIIRKSIEEDRQSVSRAREAWQKATGKEASDATFKRFLEVLVQDIDV